MAGISERRPVMVVNRNTVKVIAESHCEHAEELPWCCTVGARAKFSVTEAKKEVSHCRP